jgi:hypothetical protein
MISESIRRRGVSVGEVSYKGHGYPAEIIAHGLRKHQSLALLLLQLQCPRFQRFTADTYAPHPRSSGHRTYRCS